MLIINKLFKYSVSTEAPRESSSWKETSEEIVRYSPCGRNKKKKKKKKEKKADLNNNALWMKSDLL